MEQTFQSLAFILGTLGTVDTRFKILAFAAGRAAPQGVAMLNPSGGLVLLQIGPYPTRMVRRGEDVESLVREILERVGALPAKAA